MTDTLKEYHFTLKEYHFTDEQIDMIYNLVFNMIGDDEYKSYRELANQIEDQIVNHPTNS
jgi:hypothetical protein